jgi:hypothetical protein
MSEFRIRQLPKSTIRELSRLRPKIDLEPVYQRQSGVWDEEAQQLLIDSLLNGMDVPKFYFHALESPTFRYAVIDGKQRLEAIWKFVDGNLRLAKDFEYFANPKLKLGGLTFEELGHEAPRLAAAFEQTELTVMVAETSDVEMIEEMFSRLNEAVPLNAPEKRNARGGPLPQVVRDLAKREFFTACLWIENNRYRHFDLASKFLLIEHSGKATSTKKRDLDDFFADFYDRNDRRGAQALESKVGSVLDKMAKTFDHPDPLLSSIGMIVVYYLLFRATAGDVDRKQLVAFDEARERNRAIDREIARRLRTGEALGKLPSQSIKALTQFQAYSQSLNDPTALGYRVGLIGKFLRTGKLD